MALKNLIATDADKNKACAMTVDHLRELLRDVYDVVSSGENVGDGLLSRIRSQMANGRKS